MVPTVNVSPTPSVTPTPTVSVTPSPSPTSTPTPVQSTVVFEINFDDASQIETFDFEQTSEVDVERTFDTSGALNISPTWKKDAEGAFLFQNTFADPVNFANSTLTMDVQLPASYVSDGSLYTELWLISDMGNKNSLGFYKQSNTYSSDQYTTLTFDITDNATEGFYPNANADLSKIERFGLKFVGTGKPIGVTGDILVDNIKLTSSGVVTPSPEPLAQALLVSFEDGESTGASVVENLGSIQSSVTGVTDGSKALRAELPTDNDYANLVIIDLSQEIVDSVVAGTGQKITADIVFDGEQGTGNYGGVAIVDYRDGRLQFNSDPGAFFSSNGNVLELAWDLDANADNGTSTLASRIEGGTSRLNFVLNKTASQAGTITIDNIRFEGAGDDTFELVVPDYTPSGATPVYPNDDPANTLYYVNGRVELNPGNSAIAKMSYAGSRLLTKFTGTGVTVAASDVNPAAGDRNWIDVIVDAGTATEELRTVQLSEGSQESVTINGLSAGEHSLEIRKRTDINSGPMTIDAITPVGGSVIAHGVSAPSLNIEFYGDSITSGQYIELAAGVSDTNGDNTSDNGSKSYAAKTAMALNADFTVVSSSGIGLANSPFFTTTMLGLFDQADGSLFQWGGQENEWNYNQWTADVVVVNLLTNDSTAVPGQDKNDIKQSLQGFLLDLRARYPDAEIFAVNGPYIIGSQYIEALNEGVNELRAEVDTRFHSLVFENMTSAERDDGHPREARHQTMADTLVDKINEVLNPSN